MKQYLSSVQHIVGQQAIIRASRIADTAAVPTSFIEELETLRTKVDELSEERTILRAELNEQIAEVNILRALPVDRNLDVGETVSSFRSWSTSPSLIALDILSHIAVSRQNPLRSKRETKR
jgi:hypothetical protein